MIYGWSLLVYYYRLRNGELLIVMSCFVSDTCMSVAGEQGRCLLSTQPKILFCDLELAPGESRTCKFTVPVK